MAAETEGGKCGLETKGERAVIAPSKIYARRLAASDIFYLATLAAIRRVQGKEHSDG